MMKSLTIATLFILLAGAMHAGDCPHKVRIDAVTYEVPSWWCDRAIDTSLIPRAGNFMRLPAELCFGDFKIYVEKEAGQAFVKMAQSAAADSVFFKVKSGYRSMRYQAELFRKYMSDGTPFVKVAERIAPPGYSEHHTGRAFDLVADNPRFAGSEAYDWLKKKGTSFGFIESFPYDSTGLIHREPWHWYFKGLQ